MRNDRVKVLYEVGDKVLIDNKGNSFTGEVIRITPKGFIVVKPFNSKMTYTFRPDGYERTSDAWNQRQIRPLTQEDVDLIMVTKARRIAKANFERYWQVLSNQQAVEIIEILKKAEGYKE